MYKIILVGNPNTGKTTLFNTLTGSNEKASNWHGVTVGVKTKKYKYKGEEFCVADTPGVYLLEGAVAEEKITSEWLKNSNDLIINICDANNLKRNFMLTAELIKMNREVIVAVNMSNEIKLYDYENISKEFNCKIIEIDARKKKSVNILKELIYSQIKNKKTQKEYKLNNINIDIDKFKIKNSKNGYDVTDKIDNILLNKYIFIPTMLISLLFIFYIVFNGINLPIFNNINIFFSLLIDKMRKLILCVNMPYFIKLLISDAIIGSFVTILSFVPQILLLMFFINLLEDVGFMSRIAFMLDGLMKKIGLSGKSLFGIIMGYGCTTSAVISTRNLQNQSIRKRTILLLPYSTCSAKLPIFLTISSLFFRKYKFLFVFGLYIFSILIQIIYAIILNKINNTKDAYCIVEMPKYRFPNFKKICKDSVVVFKDFVFKIGALLLIFGVLMWTFQNFDLRFNFINSKNFSTSILYKISELVTPLFRPLGFANPAIVVAIIFGLIAKEFLIVSLAMMNGVVGDISLLSQSLISSSSLCFFTPISSVVFLVFVLLYSPCFSSLSAIASEIGKREAFYVFVSQFIIAYVIAFVVKVSFENFKIVVLLLAIFVLAIIILTMLKSRCKTNCKGNCDACRKTKV